MNTLERHSQTLTEEEEATHTGAIHRVDNFSNGYSASIIRYSTHVEIAVLRDGEVDTSTPITGDVLVFLPHEETEQLEALQAIIDLPAPTPETRGENQTAGESQKPNFPVWMEEISPADISAIIEGGCDSGAYMPAVTYWQALETMNQYGDDVFQMIEDCCVEVPAPPADYSWGQRACYFLSMAVELWCECHEHLADWDREDWG